MNIQTVQRIAGGGFLVNGRLAVPGDPPNRHHRAVQAWIAAGNAAAAPAARPAFEPSDLAVRLAALESKTGITEADLAAARNELITKEGQ